MKVVVMKNKINQVSSNENPVYFDKCIGFWGEVTDVDSTINRVRVLASTGMEFVGLPVASNEWVKDSGEYASGEIHLPPIGSRVFVLMPTGTIAGAFVLCSGFAPGQTQTHKNYSDIEHKNENNSIKKKTTQSGWLETENYGTGKRTIESLNKKISIEFMPEGDNAAVEINAFDTTIKINESGIVFSSIKSDIHINSQNKIILESQNDIHLTTKKFTVGNTKDSVSLEVNT